MASGGVESKVARDQHSLNLRGARVQSAADGIAQLLLDVEILHVAVAAVQLHRVERRGHGRLADVELGHRRFHRAALRGSRELPGCAIQEQARRLESYLHVGDLRSNELEASDRLPELLALFRIADTCVQLLLHASDLAREDAAALPTHGVVEDRRALTLLPEAVGNRNAAIVEHHLA